MSKKMLPVLVLMIGSMFLSIMPGFVFGAEKKPQINCPITGQAVDKQVHTDYQGWRIYFCCADCIPQFKKDGDQYLKKFEEDGIQLEKVPPSQQVHPYHGKH